MCIGSKVDLGFAIGAAIVLLATFGVGLWPERYHRLVYGSAEPAPRWYILLYRISSVPTVLFIAGVLVYNCV